MENNYFSSELKLSPKDSGTIISVNNKRYRGNIIVKVSGAKLIFINEIELENYVCGIITKEISASWPEESLKAQAVVARTYALKNMNRHKNDGYNLCATQHCQVYGGLMRSDKSNNVFAREARCFNMTVRLQILFIIQAAVAERNPHLLLVKQNSLCYRSEMRCAVQSVNRGHPIATF